MQMKLQNNRGGQKPLLFSRSLNAAQHCCSLRLKEMWWEVVLHREEGPDHKQPCTLFAVLCPKGMGAHLKCYKQKFTGSDLCGQLSGVGIGRLERDNIKANFI